MRNYRPRFLIRKIRNGRVKIRNHWFEPDKKWREYNGELDGRRYAFGLYYVGDLWITKYVYLWGTEEAYNHIEEADKPEVMPDGTLPWVWWYPVDNNG